MKSIDGGIPGAGVPLLVGDTFPLLDEEPEVGMDVLFELADGLCAEGVGDGLALASMLSAIAGVEETAADRDKGIVVLSIEI